jgi:hypothetical protein
VQPDVHGVELTQKSAPRRLANSSVWWPKSPVEIEHEQSPLAVATGSLGEFSPQREWFLEENWKARVGRHIPHGQVG